MTLAPKYYPLTNFKPQIDLKGKLAVITGASRGLGRAVGEALAALGVNVIGTSRDPAGVPKPPAFPLLALDIADPNSVLAFAAALRSHSMFLAHGHVDILDNNAGRAVLGDIIPLSAADFDFYLKQRQLGLQTVYFGHVTVTNALLPLMPYDRYSRIIFTVSIASYGTGATVASESGMDAYTSAKAVLRAYANNLDTVLRAAPTSIRVSTVNPYFMNTALVEHPNPIYTQPVNARPFTRHGAPASPAGPRCSTRVDHATADPARRRGAGRRPMAARNQIRATACMPASTAAPCGY